MQLFETRNLSDAQRVAREPRQKRPLSRLTDRWLKFGEPPAKDNIYNLSPDMWIKSQAGQLVLFPSYFWHGREPFQSDDPRLTVAFDIAGKI